MLVFHLKQALRTLTRLPAHTGVLLLTTAVTVGVASSAFSVAHGVLLRPLDYPHQDRLVRLSEHTTNEEIALFDARLSLMTYESWRRSKRTVDEIATYESRRVTVGVPGDAVSVQGAAVSPEFFGVFSLMPSQGRFFEPGEAAPVVVISHALWRGRLGGDPGAIGTSLSVEGVPREVIGVAAPGFAFPDDDSTVWMNATQTVDPARRPNTSYLVIARLKAGVTVEQAMSEGLEAARSAGWKVDASDVAAKAPGSVVVHVRTLLEDMTASVAPGLTLIAVGATVLVIAAGVNLATVLLSMMMVRQREFAIRTAIGASRSTLAKQVLLEGSILSVVACAVGLVIALWLLRYASVLAPPGFPRAAEITMDWRTVTAAVGISAIIFAMSTVLTASRWISADVDALLGRTGTGTGVFTVNPRGAKWTYRCLLTVQTAVATMLIVGASLLIHSFVRLVNVEGGYSPDHVLVAQINLPGADVTRKQAFLTDLLERIRTVPGVVSAGGGNMLPFSDSLFLSRFELGPKQTGGKERVVRTLQYVVTVGYAEALGLGLRDGRFFSVSDLSSASAVAMVNEEFARRHLSSDPVVGRLFLKGLGSVGVTTEIVGVVRNVLKDGMDQQPRPELYLLNREGLPVGRDLNVVMRTAQDPSTIGPVVRSLIRQVDANAALALSVPLRDRVALSVAYPRFATTAITFFALQALVLACVGLYGSVSASVSARLSEFSVRSALGATPCRLVGHALSSYVLASVTGVGLGLLASAIAARAFRALLFGITALDAVSFTAAALVVLVTATVACVIPALRVSTADPKAALRVG